MDKLELALLQVHIFRQKFLGIRSQRISRQLFQRNLALCIDYGQ